MIRPDDSRKTTRTPHTTNINTHHTPRLTLLICLLLPTTASAARPVAGGAGYATAFVGNDVNTISARWDALTPHDKFTLEYWAKRLDDLAVSGPVFAYSAYSFDGRLSDGGLPYEGPNEIGLWHSKDKIDFHRGNSKVTYFTPDNETHPSGTQYWTHYAVAWSADAAASPSGHQVALYLNGSLVVNSSECALETCDMGHAVQPDGIIHLGQDADSPYSDFDIAQAFTGVVDEMRLWNTLRTDAEIAASYARGFDAAVDAAADLALYWRFDQPVAARGSIVNDAPPNASAAWDGMLGMLTCPATKEMRFQGGRAPQLPAAPVLLASTAPLVGAGPVVKVLDAEGRTMVSLTSYDADADDLSTTIVSAPAYGTLYDASGAALAAGDVVVDALRTSSKRVWYEPWANRTAAAGAGSGAADGFRFSVSDSSGGFAAADVHMLDFALPTPTNETLTLDEDMMGHLSLGRPYVPRGEPAVTRHARVIISSLPASGTLYQACVAEGALPSYKTFCAPGDARMEPIMAEGTELTHPRGVLLFQPAPDEHDATEYAVFGYRFADAHNSSLMSAEAFVTVAVNSVNDAPLAAPNSIDLGAASTEAGGTYAVTFTLSDADEDATNPRTFSPSVSTHPFVRVKSYTRAGLLRQRTSALVDPLLPPIGVEVVEYGHKVLRFSSQWDTCDACGLWSGAETTGCNQATSGAVVSDPTYDTPYVWGDASCTDVRWTAQQILGEPNAWPTYSDSPNGMDWGSSNGGEEFIEVLLKQPLYVHQVFVYEAYKPGSVTRLAGAPVYADDNSVACCGPTDRPAYFASCAGAPPCAESTEWRTLWQGTAAPTNKEEARRFAPPICPGAEQVRVLRLEADTTAVSGYSNLDAIEVRGTVVPDADLVTPDPTAAPGSENSLLYEPRNGTHGVDRLTFEGSDCEAWGAEAGVDLIIPAPATGFIADPFVARSATLMAGTDGSVQSGAITFDLDGAGDADVVMALSAEQIQSLSPRGDGTTATAMATARLVGVAGGVTSVQLGVSFLPSDGSAVDLPLPLPSTMGAVLRGDGGVAPGLHAEVWLTLPHVNGSDGVTFRLQAHACTAGSVTLVDAGSAVECVPCAVASVQGSSSRDQLAIQLCGDNPVDEWRQAILIGLLAAGVFLFGAVAIAVYVWHSRRRRYMSKLRVGSYPPDLDIGSDGLRYHIFLSHRWATAQDQVGVIRNEVVEMMPKVRCFLDIFDLDDISQLEAHIRASSCVLLFLSRGYFTSPNCLREVREAVRLAKPLVLVHEADPSHGGCSLSEMVAECPEELRDALFYERSPLSCGTRLLRPIVRWCRKPRYQAEVIASICLYCLRTLPRYGRQQTPSTKNLVANSASNSADAFDAYGVVNGKVGNDNDDDDAPVEIEANLAGTARLKRLVLAPAPTAHAISYSTTVFVPKTSSVAPLVLDRRVRLYAPRRCPGALKAGSALCALTQLGERGELVLAQRPPSALTQLLDAKHTWVSSVVSLSTQYAHVHTSSRSLDKHASGRSNNRSTGGAHGASVSSSERSDKSHGSRWLSALGNKSQSGELDSNVAVTRIQRIVRKKGAEHRFLNPNGRRSKLSEAPKNVFLLHLSPSMWDGRRGELLADEVRCARAVSMQILLTIDGNEDFGAVFERSPRDLVEDGLYSGIAIDLLPGRLMLAAAATFTKAIGGISPGRASYFWSQMSVHTNVVVRTTRDFLLKSTAQPEPALETRPVSFEKRLEAARNNKRHSRSTLDILGRGSRPDV